MKVIAKISDSVLLCEVSTGEIGKLHGTGGANEEVVAEESQMMYLLFNLPPVDADEVGEILS